MKTRLLSFSFIGIAALGISGSTTGTAYAGLLGIDLDTGTLYSVSTANAALTLIGSNGRNFAEIEFSPGGTLYGFTTGSASTLYTINPSTAAATSVGPLGLPFVFEGGLAFSPGGTAYATNGGDSGAAQLFTINLATGAATVVGTLSGGGHDINGLAYRSDGQLIGLDRVTNALVVIDPATAAVAQLAPVPSTVGGVGGMTVLNGTGYYNTSGPGGSISGSNTLYSFDLFTGASTPIGNFNGLVGNGISGLAAQVPEPDAIVLGSIGALILLLGIRHGDSRLRVHPQGTVPGTVS
jgi:WD40 repeat protein